MKKKLLLCMVAIFSFQLMVGQKMLVGLDANKEISGAHLIRYVDRFTYPSHIAFAQPRRYQSDLSVYMKSVLQLPKEYGLQLVKEETDLIGFIHQNYKQTYKGFTVEYGVYKVHYKGDALASMNGDIYQVDAVNTVASISPSDAIIQAKNFMPSTMYKWEEGRSNSANYYPTTELVILVHNKKTYLAYKVDIYSVLPLARKFVYVDAATGKIIHSTERIHDIDVPGTANTVYSGSRSIIMDSTAVDFQLTESGRNLQTINFATNLPYSNATNVWSLVGLDQYALDAHWASEMTHDYYLTTFGRDGLDGAHYALTSYVNEGPGFGNAYWDGSTVHYGDGDGSFFLTPLTTVGIVGHESTHGVTQFTAGLIYAGESGAMNESFSDIFGLCVDKYARNINLGLPASWLVGAECTGGAGFRDMSNPNFFGNADTYGGAFWNAGDIVHYDSGVQNYWFYLLTMGGTGTNDLSNAYNVTGLGIADAQSIAYRSLSFYLTPGSNFADSRYYSSLAAVDLFGACSPQLASTVDAWYAVGVGGPYVNLTASSFSFGTPITCSVPASVTFTNLSFNASSYLWNFGDGDTSTLPNPSHAFDTVGTYTVSLIATGCGTNGSDTFATSVTISTGSTILNMVPAQTLDVSCCTGSLYDSGGPLAPYPDGEASASRINVPAGNIVNVNFLAFDLEFGFDFVTIYDGPNAFSPLIGTYTGNTLPNGGAVISSTSNQMYIEFSSDGSVNANGFELNWYCTPPAPPIAAFTNSLNTSTVCIGSFVDYFNASIYADSIYWDFPGGSPAMSLLDTVSVQYNTLGSYTTTIFAYNILGFDSSFATIIVVPLPTPSISQAGNTLSVLPSFTTYQWYLNGVLIPGANSQSYNIIQGGAYYCEVTDGNNCSGITSTITSTMSIGVEGTASILIYPNPASMALFITNPLLVNGVYKVSLTNMLGETIYSSLQNTQQSMVDLSNIRAGSYLVKISQDNWEITRKVIVVK